SRRPVTHSDGSRPVFLSFSRLSPATISPGPEVAGCSPRRHWRVTARSSTAGSELQSETAGSLYDLAASSMKSPRSSRTRANETLLTTIVLPPLELDGDRTEVDPGRTVLCERPASNRP